MADGIERVAGFREFAADGCLIEVAVEVERGEEEVLLGLEGCIDAAGVEAGDAGDLRHTGGFVAVFPEGLHGFLDDFFPVVCCSARHSYLIL